MNRLEWFMAAAIVVLLILILATSIAEQRRWEVYRVEHACKEAGYVTGTTGWGTDSKGNMVTVTTPGKTRFLCDAGAVEIYR